MPWLILLLSLVAGASNWAFRVPREDQMVHLKCTIEDSGTLVLVILDLTTHWAALVVPNAFIASGPMFTDPDGNRILRMAHGEAQLALYVSGRAVFKSVDGKLYDLTCEDKDGGLEL